LALAIASTVTCCAWGAAAAVAAPAFPKTVCGHFFRSSQDFIVYAGGGLQCSKATPMIESFVHGKAKQHGTTDADSYWTIGAFPGFKCIQSMGEGQCVKGKEIAAYKIKASG
jgi:hypothetical protein